jgi:hypothetical protein
MAGRLAADKPDPEAADNRIRAAAALSAKLFSTLQREQRRTASTRIEAWCRFATTFIAQRAESASQPALVLENTGRKGIVPPALGSVIGGTMKKLAVVAALLATCAQSVIGQSAWAAGNCYSPTAIEAEEAIRYVTDLMVISSSCRDTKYAEFKLRNRDQIVNYQKALITHFHGNAAFDKWNTSLANVAAQKQAGLTVTQVCQQQATMLKQASMQDAKAFRAFALQQAAAASTRYAKCGK